MEHAYIAIDLKSFYASAECQERGRDPLTTNLVVADVSRTEKTICLAVSLALESYGIPGRARLFEVVQQVKEPAFEQLDLFTDYTALEKQREKEQKERGKERALQEAMLSIRKRYGNDAVLRGLNLQEGATGRERAKQIGGHKS